MADPPSLYLFKPSNEEQEKVKERLGEIISCLPKGKGWISHHIYLYQGFWYENIPLEGAIFAQENFKARSSDVLLATNFKCGTTWLKSLAFAIKIRALYQNDHETQHPLLTANPHSHVPNLEFGLFRGKSLVEIENLPSPRLLSTHMPYSSLPESIHGSGCRVVYLCRDPKDMFVSMWHFQGKMNHKRAELPIISLEEAFELFVHGGSLFGPYWDHVLGYYKASLESPEKFLVFKYEDMQNDTLNHVKRLAEFMGYPFSMEEEAKGVAQEIVKLCSFENMSNSEVIKNGADLGVIKNDAFFRKGVVGDSKNYLTAEMMDVIDGISKEKFQGLQLLY